MNLKYDVVVIGGGAAGLFCAIEAAKRHRKVLVIERNAQVGRKIIISGGGRCNFTNIHTTAENFVSKNPHFCKSALARYTPQDFISLLRSHKIDFYEKKLGQLFCRESSRNIVDMLLSECRRAKVEIKTGSSVSNIERNDEFVLDTTIGQISCGSLVVATGGLSFAKVGATDFGYDVARQFGLKVEPTRPALVPLIFANRNSNRALAGTSVESIVSTKSASFRENILFTHRGLSGPAILQISNYWNRDETVSIDLMPSRETGEIVEWDLQSRHTLAKYISQFIPAKLAENLLPADLAKAPISKLSAIVMNKVMADLKDWRLKFRDTEGYDKAEVTAGGVSTRELSSQTMETTNVPGLFFIGEIVDVTGWLGGYNFQWAWASGYAAGQAV